MQIDAISEEDTRAYLLRVLSTKEKKVMGLFAREGVETTQLPIGGYLLCRDSKCKTIRFLETIENYVINLTEITEDEAERLTKRLIPATVTEDLRVGKIVTIVEGEYTGQNGVIRKINDGKIHVDVCLFGRMRQVNLETHQLALSVPPEAWR